MLPEKTAHALDLGIREILERSSIQEIDAEEEVEIMSIVFRALLETRISLSTIFATVADLVHPNGRLRAELIEKRIPPTTDNSTFSLTETLAAVREKLATAQQSLVSADEVMSRIPGSFFEIDSAIADSLYHCGEAIHQIDHHPQPDT